MELHTIKPAKGSRRKARRLGRGNGSSKGTTAGRGTKGQGARSGGRNRRVLRGMRRLILSTPKLRGFKSPKERPATVTLSQLNVFDDGASITPRTLKSKGLVTVVNAGVKILGTGELKKKINVKGCLFTNSAKEAIEKAGGSAN